MTNARRTAYAYSFALLVMPLLQAYVMVTYDVLAPLLFVPLILIATLLGGTWPGMLATAIPTGAHLAFAPLSTLNVLRIFVLLAIGISASYIVRRFQQISREAEQNRSAERELSQAVLHTQASARVSDERFAQLASAISEVFWMTNVEKTEVLYVSPAYERIWGMSASKLYAEPHTWLEGIHPSDRERVAAAWTSSGVFNIEYRVTRPDGSVRWIHDKASQVCDNDGKLIALAGIAEDVTERRELEEQLRQTQKLESMGLFAGGVAHDFNNLLGVITANANMISEGLPEGHADRELVDEIDAAVMRAAALTRQLLAFSRKQVTEPVVLDINRSVADTSKMLRRLVGEDIVVQTSLDPDLLRVRFDQSSLVQVLMNLAVNARDAMPQGGTLTISTRNTNNKIELSVSDTGCGMSREVLTRVFEPFFTTKELGKGTGLGLPVVHGIVQQAGGTIEIESEVGAGTAFRIKLPSVDLPADPVLDHIANASRGHEKIVLVEDDCYVRAAASRSLRARGYTVLEASEGRAALRLLRDHKADVSLLVTDIVMPGMNGRELAELATERMPGLPVLFMSGYADDNNLRQSVQRADVHFIEKPFRIQAFAAKVRQILDEAAVVDACAEWLDSSAHLTRPLNERDVDQAAAKPQLTALVSAAI
ncbi:MAG: ATP-binding protein [Myxococcota bacterium]|nr:PAS domain-containing protein [Deltaproteobacteria bacterium]MDQ3335221.1 ATP-binding protein [Myxococcota bacterium]